MTEPTPNELMPGPFSDDQAHRILRRAVELHELRGTQWGEADLVSIAADLGIDRQTVRAAITEVASTPGAPAASRTTRLVESALLAGFGAATFVPVAIWDLNALPATVTVGATSVLLALDSDEGHPVGRFLGRSVALWGGFWVGGSTQFDMAPDLTLFLIMGSPVVGGLVSLGLIRLARHFNTPSRPKQHRPPLFTRVASTVRRMVARRPEHHDVVERSASYRFGSSLWVAAAARQ
ncbi:MAG TPA: hypothetical protein VMO26_12745 [Vicinamibacterales bacterium]|nr:hypothetical protein [Vicinamibacterales bacterium]